jgi:hypothetical protein
MRLRAALAALAALGALAAAMFSDAPHAAAAAPSAATMEVDTLRDGPGRDLTVGRCIICHSAEYIPSNAPAMNRAAWQKTIQKMRERFGAPITDEETKQILDYLDTNYSGKTG